MPASKRPITPANAPLVAWVLWGATAAALLLYLGLGAWLRLKLAPASAGLVVPLLAALSLAGLAFQVWVRRQIEDERLFPKVLLAWRATIGRGAGEGAAGTDLPSFEERSVSTLLELRIALQVILWAISDAVACLGLLATLLTGQRGWLLAFAAVAAVLLLHDAPRGRGAREQAARWQRHLAGRAWGGPPGANPPSD